MVADELRRQADFFLDLSELQGHVAREYQARHDDAARSRGRLPDDDDDGEFDDEQALSRPGRRPIPTAASARACARFAQGSGRPSRTGSTRRCPRSGRPRRGCWWSGLAPGLRGANRTGRPFTGDFAGDGPLSGPAAGTASRAAATAPIGRRRVRAGRLPDHQCGPLCAAGEPADAGRERRPAGSSWSPSSPGWTRPSVILALGRIAHELALRALGLPQRGYPFAHGAMAPSCRPASCSRRASTPRATT